uniref:Carboxypeptidase n=1 Tax=Macrostomum lignano TaxID=282301 RepID=A0A1I8J2C2_9PLAT
MRPVLTMALCLCCCALAECQRRRVEELPRLLFRPNFTQYSGYLTSSSGSGGSRRLFYWLVESSHVDAATAPLVLWMNGGPGCSSVGGLLMTNGPFLANDRAELERNDFAWNRLANVLYIDSPSGVGLSEPGPTDPTELNDNATTRLNLGALLHFYSLFPEYRGRAFYIAGESYAGIYIPLLASAIIDGGHWPSLINLKGIAVGNGLHVSINDNALLETRKEFAKILGISFRNDTAIETNLSVNSYNVMHTCYEQESVNVYPCLNTTGLVTYLRDKRVREALGVSDSVSENYVICSLVKIFTHYNYLDRDILPELRRLASADVFVLLYHGTLDYMIPTMLTQRLLERLPQDNDTEGAWFYCHWTFGRASTQIGGMQRSYLGGRLFYRTVIGAGHTVVTDRPDVGFQIFTDFLSPDKDRQPRCLPPESLEDASSCGAEFTVCSVLPKQQASRVEYQHKASTAEATQYSHRCLRLNAQILAIAWLKPEPFGREALPLAEKIKLDSPTMRPVLSLALCLCCCALAECQRRRVEELPRLLFRPNFTQYSGYLTSSSGSGGSRRLFYWLVESSHVDAATAPLVLWMNGGPGCSSVGGLLMTNGPFLANDRAELERNDFAWNRLANVLYIDSPSGVGLSEPGPTDPTELNDNATTRLNLGALLHFYSLFPEYRGRAFYIAGESYAGIYIPLLASAIIDGGHWPSLINLKGIAVGNGLHMPYNESAFKSDRRALTDAMGISIGNVSVLELSVRLSVNLYNVAHPWYPGSEADGYPGLNSTGLASFLNDRDVQNALGVNESTLQKFILCHDDINRIYRKTERDVLSEFVTLANHSVSVLLYTGALDLLLPVGLTLQLLERLSPDPVSGQDAWFWCLRRPGYGLQIGGIQRSYLGGRIRYRTVIGAGHSVATDRPEIGLQLLQDLLEPSRIWPQNCLQFGSENAEVCNGQGRQFGQQILLLGTLLVLCFKGTDA